MAAALWITSRRVPHKGQPERKQIMHLCDKMRHEKTRPTLLSNMNRQRYCIIIDEKKYQTSQKYIPLCIT